MPSGRFKTKFTKLHTTKLFVTTPYWVCEIEDRETGEIIVSELGDTRDEAKEKANDAFHRWNREQKERRKNNSSSSSSTSDYEYDYSSSYSSSDDDSPGPRQPRPRSNAILGLFSLGLLLIGGCLGCIKGANDVVHRSRPMGLSEQATGPFAPMVAFAMAGFVIGIVLDRIFRTNEL